MQQRIKDSLEASSKWASQAHVPRNGVVTTSGAIIALHGNELVRIDPTTLALSRVQVEFRKRQMSREEELLAERLRESGRGVSSFSYHPQTDSLLVNGQGTVFSVSMATGVCEEFPSATEGARLHSHLSHDGRLVGFVRSRNIFVSALGSDGQEVRVSDANGTTIMAGEADFIHQEEFGVYRTFHFQPLDAKDGVYTLFYVEFDESAVHVFNIANLSDVMGSVDPFRYPLTGTRNSTIKVKLAQVKAGVSTVIELEGMLPDWAEYVPRSGWIDENHVFVVVLDRSQKRGALLRTNIHTHATVTLYEERIPDFFVCAGEEALRPLHVFADGSLLISSEKTGFMHYYRLNVDGTLHAVTAGDWEVQPTQKYTENVFLLWVDEANQVLYFVGRKDSPLELHLYAASLRPGSNPLDIVRLTEAGFSHSAFVGGGMFLDIYSNLSTPDYMRAFALRFDEHGVLPKAVPISEPRYLTPRHVTPPGEPFFFSPPRPFTIESDGVALHGLTYLPPNYDASVRYPLVVHTYGGPGFQLVQHSYAMTRGPRSARWQYLASLGFVVSVLDNRGSSGRGLEFLREMMGKLGNVEISDQVKHVEYLVAEKIVDPTRVAIYGGSYGGYMSLMALCKHNDVFRLGFAFAPVTAWEGYDTGYTERYMGLPKENPEGYNKGNVLAYADRFPDEPDRVFIFHGGSDENVHFYHTAALCHELNALGKMYQMALYPTERHGISSTHAFVVMVSQLERQFLTKK